MVRENIHTPLPWRLFLVTCTPTPPGFQFSSILLFNNFFFCHPPGLPSWNFHWPYVGVVIRYFLWPQILSMSLTMFIKWHIILHKRFKVSPVIPHVFDSFSSVSGMCCVISVKLISKGSKQAISKHQKGQVLQEFIEVPVFIMLYGKHVKRSTTPIWQYENSTNTKFEWSLLMTFQK